MYIFDYCRYNICIVIIWEKLEFSRMLTTLNGTSIGRKLDTQRNDEVDVTLIKYVTRLHVSIFEK